MFDKMAHTGLSLASLCILVVSATAEYRQSNGRVTTTNKWQLLDRWSFDSGSVRFNYNITFPRSYSPMKLLFYKYDQYILANDTKKLCEEKVAELQKTNSVPNQILNLQDTMTLSGCRRRNDQEMGDSVYCSGRVEFNVGQGMMWYVVANRCGSRNFINGMDFRYWMDNSGERETPGWKSDYPRFSGQSEVRFSTLTLAFFFIMTYCLA